MRDLHVHTDFCDGTASPQAFVDAAIKKGMEEIGFSGHSYTFFDESYCIKKDRIAEYKAEIAQLKEEYAGKIKILCGIEQDYYSDAPTDGFDYVIGSVHYIKAGDCYFPIDEDAKTLKRLCTLHYGGDFYALCEDYFALVADVAKKTNADIIGHFDLITKFNEGFCLFDENHPRYITASRAAADKLLSTKIPFEINTGAVFRGYRSEAYPSRKILEYIAKNNGKSILSGDAHSTDALCFEFGKYADLAKKLGIETV